MTKITEAIEALGYILQRNSSKLSKKFSIELEKWSNVALNILNDSQLIKPNAPVGDDNEPTYTAPNGMADIECYYQSFNAICEVTMLCSRDQWYNEGQPVMRHLRDFESKYPTKPAYCLFIAPTLHPDTINTFYTSVKYEYDGERQRIIPITIKQLQEILSITQKLIQSGKSLVHQQIHALYNQCVAMHAIRNTSDWLSHIDQSIHQWGESLVQRN